MDWRVYYEDGTVFSSTDGPPEKSPAWGVVAIGQRVGGLYDNVLCSGVPWYVYRTDHGFWMELDETGYLDCMVHHAKDVSAVRPGRYMRRDAFKAIWAAVKEWVRG